MTSRDQKHLPLTVPRAPRLPRGHARVASLLTAGAQVFAEKGYDAATMTEIAERAGAAIGTLYQFFPTKAVLATALHGATQEALLTLLDTLRQQAATQPADAATLADRLFAGLADFLSAHPAFLALSERRDIAAEARQEKRARLLARVAALMQEARPALPAGRPEILAVMLLEMMKSVVTLSALETPARHARISTEFRQMLHAYLRGAVT